MLQEIEGEIKRQGLMFLLVSVMIDEFQVEACKTFGKLIKKPEGKERLHNMWELAFLSSGKNL